MIIILNPSKLARQDFFKELIHFLAENKDVTLRQIKTAFPDVAVDRQLERYIQAGYILRENRRYQNAFSLLSSIAEVEEGKELFVDTNQPIYKELKTCYQTRQTLNTSNAVIIEEEVDLLREDLTLDSYFYKMQTQEELSPAQAELYAILGDVNPEYALKYMTTFLLKFTRKNRVLQKRPDIFVRSLEVLGFVQKVEEHAYELSMELDKEALRYKKTKKS
ncbi:DUF1803 domain-containing protein [Streptococcus cameli]